MCRLACGVRFKYYGLKCERLNLSEEPAKNDSIWISGNSKIDMGTCPSGWISTVVNAHPQNGVRLHRITSIQPSALFLTRKMQYLKQ
jgi:hypothetical protein